MGAGESWQTPGLASAHRKQGFFGAEAGGREVVIAVLQRGFKSPGSSRVAVSCSSLWSGRHSTTLSPHHDTPSLPSAEPSGYNKSRRPGARGWCNVSMAGWLRHRPESGSSEKKTEYTKIEQLSARATSGSPESAFSNHPSVTDVLTL